MTGGTVSAGGGRQDLLTVRVGSASEVLAARQRAGQLAAGLGLSAQGRTRFATGVSELARNALMYAGGGRVTFSLEPGTRLLWARVVDGGPGIGALDQILAGQISSTTGLGVGLSGTRRLVDAFEIETRPGQGTCVQIGQRCPPHADLGADALARQFDALLAPWPEEPLEALQAQNQALLSAMTELAQREDQLRALNRELEDTNRGIVALYSDLETSAEQLRVADRQLRDLNAGLTQRVEERTARLAELNDEMTAYVRSLSRDIQEPLRRVQGFLQLLRRRLGGAPDETVDRYLDIIAGESGRVGDLVEDLANLMREGGRRLAQNQVPLNVLIVQVRSDLEALTRGRRVEWRIAPLPTVVGDVLLLRQAFTQVLHNALKFSSTRERAVIEVGSELRGGETVVWVTDNGVGFDPADASRLFQLFARLHGEAFEGSGLGLANVRRVLSRHGGRAWAEGRADQGATFYLALPTSPAAQDERP